MAEEEEEDIATLASTPAFLERRSVGKRASFLHRSDAGGIPSLGATLQARAQAATERKASFASQLPLHSLPTLSGQHLSFSVELVTRIVRTCRPSSRQVSLTTQSLWHAPRPTWSTKTNLASND